VIAGSVVGQLAGCVEDVEPRYQEVNAATIPFASDGATIAWSRARLMACAARHRNRGESVHLDVSLLRTPAVYPVPRGHMVLAYVFEEQGALALRPSLFRRCI
jgi:hypothetical protein